MAHPPLETFQIGWICALPIEAAAAGEMLDEKFGLLGAQDKSDTNTYTLGRISHHNVAIACLPAGQYGLTSATTVANNMLRTFSKSLRLGLMVGVGGGIPSAVHDVRLGDIVISCPEGTSGGVLQYDMGKVGVGGEFQRTGSLDSPPRSLLTAINLMRAAELTEDPRFPGYINTATERNARTRRNFGRPTAKQDRLFKLKYEHPENEVNCDGCSAEWEETRSERDTGEPQLHYGIIASGNSLIKHGWTREKLRLQTGALCFEMEAAGLMDFPCIVIRGICDYADSHKNKVWQGYAALAAASYAKELLEYVPVGHVSQETLAVNAYNDLKNEIQRTNELISRSHDRQDQYHREHITLILTDKQQKCHQLFKIVNYEEQKNINTRRASGTCRWALQSVEYIRWGKSDVNDLLWVSADPGCGKSVLARSIIDESFESQASGPQLTICYFFFKDNIEQNYLGAAFCSILHQLFSQQPQLLHHAMPSWEKNGQRLPREVDELWRIFIAAATSNASCQTICIFDALDECSETDQERLIDKLQSFYRQFCSSTEGSCLKFLVTSRPYDNIQSYFWKVMHDFPYLHLKGEEENDQIREEIDEVVKIKVLELAQTLQLSWNIQQQLEQKLLRMEQRTYLWLSLAIDNIRSTLGNSLLPEQEQIESIRMIPASVTAAYQKILSRVPDEHASTVKKIFNIMIAARRPLSIQEMAMALGIATRPQAQTTGDAGIDPISFDKKLRQICGLFVFVKNCRVYLIHQTAREFLLGKDCSDLPVSVYSCTIRETEDEMGAVCMRYLLMNDFKESENQTDCEFWSFLEYAAVHWAEHMQDMTPDPGPGMIELLYKVYADCTAYGHPWRRLFWRTQKGKPWLPIDGLCMNKLQFAAFNRHAFLVKAFLSEDKRNINTSDDLGYSPLHWATLNGDEKTVQLLLENGVDVNSVGGHKGTALFAACSVGNERILQILLENGGDVNIPTKNGGTALAEACHHENEEIVKMLLKHGANVNAQYGRIENALQSACYRGHNKIVEILLQHGAEVNDQPTQWGNALQAACGSGNKTVVQMLLNYGADVNSQAGPNGTALHYACLSGDRTIVQLLLNHGADMNALAKNGKTPLQIACAQGNYTVWQLLSGENENMNMNNDEAESVNTAAPGGHLEVVKVLFSYGAGNQLKDKHGRTPLHNASSDGLLNLCRFLEANGAGVNTTDGRGWTPLHEASHHGHVEVCDFLLARNAQLSLVDSHGRSSLHLASTRGHYEVVKSLLGSGADATSMDQHGWTPLHAASAWGHSKVCELLLERGTNVNVGNKDGWTALHEACFHGQSKICGILLEHGARIAASDDLGRTPLSLAAERGLEDPIRVLLAYRAEIATANNNGQTPAQIASSKGHHGVVKMLMDHISEVTNKSNS